MDRVRPLPPESEDQAREHLRRAKAPPDPPGASRPAGPATPYSRAEVERLLAQADAWPHPARRRALLAPLAVGLGTGVSAGEYGLLRGTDVTIEPGGAVLLTVRGPRVRTVPALIEHEDLLAKGAATACPGPLVDRRGTGGTARTPRKALPAVGTPALLARRCRATWLRTQVASGTRLDTLAEAAGLISRSSIVEAARHLDPPSVEERRRLLRGS